MNIKSYAIKFNKLLLTFLLVSSYLLNTGYAQFGIYVKADATGSNSGSSWNNAYTKLEDALNAADDDDVILVARGTYTVSNGFVLTKDASIIGGYTGNEGGILPNPTDPLNNPTILRATYGIFDDPSNIFPVLKVDGTTADGIISSNAELLNLTFDGGGSGSRAGIYVNGSGTGNRASPSIRNCTFRNSAPAIEINGSGGTSSPGIVSCSFENNSDRAIKIDISSLIRIRDCQFLNNSAGGNDGGAIYARMSGLLEIEDCTFQGNTALTGGAISNFPFTNSARTVIKDCYFSNNVASDQGGAISSWGTELQEISKCQFVNNSGRLGGAIFLTGADGEIFNCLFRGNFASVTGNATYSALTAQSSTSFNLKFYNCSFYQNKPANGSGDGIYVAVQGSIPVSNELRNCILWDNGDNEIGVTSGGAATVEFIHSLLDDGNPDGDVQLPAGVSGTNNLDGDPMFENGEAHLACSSPAIDAGGNFNNSPIGFTDLWGNIRYNSPFNSYTTIDMGSFEYQSIPTGSDSDGDGVVAACDNCPSLPSTGMNFDGSNDFMRSVISELSTGAGDITIEAWIYLDAIPSARSWVLSLGLFSTGAIHWLLNPSGEMFIGVFNGGALSTDVMPTQKWIHVATVFNNTTMTLYIDGLSKGTVATSLNLPNTSLNLARKWAFAGDQYFNGSIDDVRIWNTVRTVEQINAFRNRELSGNEANLVSYFRLNEGIVSGDNTNITTIKDQAGTSDGELLNMTKSGSSSNWVIGAPVIQDASCIAPLPLDLLSFSGIPLAKGNQLKWLVANEYDTEVHMVETSQDGKSFEEIGKVNAGTTSYYQWLHEQPARRAYYRIRTLDLDGAETFSNTILIERETPKAFAIQNIFPVPAQDEVNVTFALPFTGQLQIEVLNLTGQRISKQTQTLDTGNHQLMIPTHSLVSGTYFLRLVQADGTYGLRKFVIQK